MTVMAQAYHHPGQTMFQTKVAKENKWAPNVVLPWAALLRRGVACELERVFYGQKGLAFELICDNRRS